VWEKAATYRPDTAKVSTWLMRISRNRAIDVLRSLRSAGRAAPSSSDDLEWAVDPAPGPQEDAARDHCRDEVRDAVAGLPADQRRALSLAFFKGLTHREISQLVGEPLGTVKTRIRDAMQKLRGQISEECAP
jgi:RNA polymerase sigma-70 factor (ECF subfamily)